METIAALARLESPSGDADALHRCGVAITTLLEDAGALVEALDGGTAGAHLRATFGTGERQVLLLGHFDTVWPIGTIEQMPVEVRDGRLYGPGTFDMKAGLVLAICAARVVAPALRRLRLRCLFTVDEEVGSETSRGLIEAEARSSDAVLVFEPALPGGVLKTARKGVGTWRLDVHGVSAHAGISPEAGASAITELARQILAMHELQAPALGTTINAGVVAGGSRSNVVAEHAHAEIDVRVSAAAEQARIERAFAALDAADPRVRLAWRGGFDRPPMERGPHVQRLFAVAREAGAALGLEVGEGATGGASDGNFTAALGVPTLDGLGAIGDGAHARHEHVEIASLADRAALAAAIILRLDETAVAAD
ncbi:peptidase M20 [Luteitalea sp. TBR-22]|nr:peptidase M20 [Luteitalea sp. TBR-22]